MVLEVYTKDCKRENLIAIYGGYFEFAYKAENKEIRVTTQVETRIYPCVKIDFSVNGNFCYVCTEEQI
jgi:hypothetical protein